MVKPATAAMKDFQRLESSKKLVVAYDERKV